jgi:peptidoglycan/LPS O-acetylase OafA/YrhL
VQTDLIAVLCLLATTVFGCLFYSLVEAPLLGRPRRRRHKPAQAPT